MIDSRKFRGSLRRTGIATAMPAAEIIWVLCLPDSVGAQSGFRGLPLSDSLSCPAAAMAVRAIMLSSSASGFAEFEKRWIETRSDV